MDTNCENLIAAEVARGLIAEEAPREIPIFKANSEAYFKDPKKALALQTAGKDKMLGFGAAEASLFLTPFALAISREIVSFLLGEVQKSFQKESAGAIEEIVRSLFKKLRAPEPEKKPLVTLTQEQLKEVHRKALAKAHELKLSDEHARHLADAIVSDLTI